jgi:hypothetical protein
MGHELRDYLEIDAAEARRQWAAVLQRSVPADGKR